MPTTKNPATPSDDEGRAPWRPLAAAAIAASVLVVAGYGAWAGLSATASNETPQNVASGTLKLEMGANGAGFSQSVSNMAPGDTVHRYVSLTNSGSLAAQGMTMGIATTGSSVLVSDGASSKALRVSVDLCSVAWNATTGACAGTVTPAVSSTVLGTLATPATLSGIAQTASAAVYNLRVSVQLPDQNETTVNGTLPAGTVQNASANLTYTFTETQRTATTTSS
jgi:hypothetical protein